MPEQNGFIKRLNGHKTAFFSTVGGFLLLVFTAGGAWYTTSSLANENKNLLDTYGEIHVDRRELNLTLKPVQQKLNSLEKSVEEIKSMQREQGQEIIRELRRINSSDG